MLFVYFNSGTLMHLGHFLLFGSQWDYSTIQIINKPLLTRCLYSQATLRDPRKCYEPACKTRTLNTLKWGSESNQLAVEIRHNREASSIFQCFLRGTSRGEQHRIRLRRLHASRRGRKLSRNCLQRINKDWGVIYLYPVTISPQHCTAPNTFDQRMRWE